MNRVKPANPRLAALEPYDPKNLPAEVFLSANENSRNLPEPIVAKIAQRMAGFAYNRYPDAAHNELREYVAKLNGLKRENVLFGNGGDELIFNLMLTWGGEGRTMLNVTPTFSVYRLYAEMVGTQVIDVPRNLDFTIDEEAVIAAVENTDVDFLIITSPNNPSGDVVSQEFVERLLNATDALVLIDEAYAEFSGETVLPLLAQHKNLMILHTLSKAYSLAGVRMGYIFADPEVIDEFMKVRQPYSVDAISQIIALTVFENLDLFEESTAQIRAERQRLLEELPTISGVEVFPSEANFLLVRVADAHQVWERLYDEHSVLVRDFSRSKGLENCLRISVGLPEENDRLLAGLRAIVEGR